MCVCVTVCCRWKLVYKYLYAFLCIWWRFCASVCVLTSTRKGFFSKERRSKQHYYSEINHMLRPDSVGPQTHAQETHSLCVSLLSPFKRHQKSTPPLTPPSCLGPLAVFGAICLLSPDLLLQLFCFFLPIEAHPFFSE